MESHDVKSYGKFEYMRTHYIRCSIMEVMLMSHAFFYSHKFHEKVQKTGAWL